MKKFILIASALCLAMTVSCNKVVEDRINPSGDGRASANLVEFSFPVNQELTKAYLDGTTFKWSDGDQVALCYGSTVAPFTYNPETGLFKGELDASATGPFYVVSPYSADIALVGGKVQATLPAAQVAGEHGADPAAFLAVGQAADAAALEAGVSLRNAFSLVRVTVTDTDVTSISFEGNPSGTSISEPLAGPVEIDPSDASFVCDSRNTAVTLKPSGAAFAAGSYDIAVLPQNLANGMKIVFKRDGEDLAYYKKSEAAKQLERNKGIEFPSFTVSGIATRCRYIQNAADMQAWDAIAYADFTADDVIYLGEDIDMDGVAGWVPVNQFIGTFDGQNHRIYNFQISSNEYVGMFRINKNSTDKADIRNLVFGTKDGATWDGVSSITHTSSKNRTTWYYLGVVAKTQGSATMENVFNYAKVEVAAGCNGKTRAAGVCGNWSSTEGVQNCYNYGTVINNATESGQKSASNTGVEISILGGVLAQCDTPVTISSCYNYGEVVNNNPYVKWIGGILGNTSQVVTVSECENYGNLTNNVAAYTSWLGTGGIVGFLNKAGAKILKCKCTGAVLTSASQVVSGIVAQILDCEVSDCTVSDISVTATGGGFCSGIVGWESTAGGTIKNCSVTGSSFTGAGRISGIVGRLQGGIVSDCSVSDCAISNSSAYSGGIVGVAETTPTVTDCSVSRTKIYGAGYTGGIVGYASGATYAKVENCVVDDLTLVSGTGNVGGIIGWLDMGDILKCKVTGGATVVGSADGVGGIVGRAIAKSGNANLIDNCLIENASVSGAYSVGGIVGYEYPDASGPVDIYNCGVASTVTLCATSCDTDGDPTQGDCMIGGIVGWARCKDDASSFKIVNCYNNAPITCDLAMAHPSAGGILGYVSLSDAGAGLVANCSTNITADLLKVGGSAVTAAAQSYGALFGNLPDVAGIAVLDNCYIDALPVGAARDSESAIIDISATAALDIRENNALAEATFGASAVGKLNLFASSYTAHQLFGWKAESGLPVLSDAAPASSGGGVEEYGDDVPFTW
ncbi:MAG: hypothetical protein J5640_01375 [Bacteroidales bacterium]|nr:hypothetical protein [Bacteroidales bacterium]